MAIESDSVQTKHRWLLPLLAVLLLGGIGVTLYLTRFHEIELYGDQSATLSNCPQTETTNCEVVNTSAYSEFLGIPISALGIPTYLLLLLLLGLGWHRPRFLAYAFAIGILTVAYSVYLYYVSTVKVGYLCAWCFRLYCINASIPVLSCLAAWRSPWGLLRETLAVLRRPPRELRRIAAAFACLLILTVAGDRAYRFTLSGSRPAGATPGTSGSTPAANGAGAASASSAPFHAASPLKEFYEKDGKLQLRPFDLNGRLGKGKPVALVFWAPGLRLAEEGLVSLARFLREQTPQIDTFAVVGASPEERGEIQWEPFCMLQLPADLPLLRDDSFSLFKQLGLTGLPEAALFDARGDLVTAHIQGLKQIVGGAPQQELTAEDLIRQVARGASPGSLPELRPYYPASELFGRCAPAFHLPELFTGKDVAFSPRSENGKPTLLMFWSSTCKHCQKEIPQLLRYVKSHPDQFNMVSVTLIRPDRPDGFSHRKITEAYVRTNGIPWQVLDDSSSLASDLYKIISTPTTFLIAPSGEILGAWFHPHEDLEAAIPPVLAQLARSGGECAPSLPGESGRASFSVAGLDGRKVSIDSLTDRPAVVHLWATWCAPCQAELPSLLKFRGALERRGGRVVLVSVEDAGSADRVMKFGSRMTAGFESFLAPEGGLADRLDLSYSVPRTYLIARGGEVVRTYRGAQPWQDPTFEQAVFTLLQVMGRS